VLVAIAGFGIWSGNQAQDDPVELKTIRSSGQFDSGSV